MDFPYHPTPFAVLEHIVHYSPFEATGRYGGKGTPTGSARVVAARSVVAKGYDTTEGSATNAIGRLVSMGYAECPDVKTMVATDKARHAYANAPQRMLDALRLQVPDPRQPSSPQPDTGDNRAGTNGTGQVATEHPATQATPPPGKATDTLEAEPVEQEGDLDVVDDYQEPPAPAPKKDEPLAQLAGVDLPELATELLVQVAEVLTGHDVVPADQGRIETLEHQLEARTQEVSRLEREVVQWRTKADQAATAQGVAERRLGETQDELSQVKGWLGKANKRIGELQNEVDHSAARYRSLHSTLRERLSDDSLANLDKIMRGLPDQRSGS